MNAPADYEIAHLKLPPHSNEAEQSVIGGLMINSERIDDVCDMLTPEDFYRLEHRRIFIAIVAVHESGQPVDTTTIADYLNTRGEMERVGGYGYLAQMANQTPSTSNIRAYALAVKKQSRSRKLITAGQAIAELGFSTEGTIDEREEQALGELAKIGEARKSDVSHINELLKTAMDRVDERFNDPGEVTGTPTGLHAIDRRLLGLQPGNLIVIAGRPSMGKTTFAMNVAENVVCEEGPVLVFSMEMSKEELTERMFSSIAQIPLWRIQTGKLLDDDWPKLSAAISKLKDKPLYIDDRPGLNITQMRTTARRYNRKGQLRLVVVDYLQLATAKGEKREQEISAVSRGLKALAKENHCTVMALSQLNRDCEKRPDKRPELFDLRESGAIEQDADIIGMCYRDEFYNEDSLDKGIAEMIWRKFRNGRKGTDRLGCRMDMARFENLEGGEVAPSRALRLPAQTQNRFEY